MNYRLLPLLALMLGGCAVTRVDPPQPAPERVEHGDGVVDLLVVNDNSGLARSDNVAMDSALLARPPAARTASSSPIIGEGLRDENFSLCRLNIVFVAVLP